MNSMKWQLQFLCAQLWKRGHFLCQLWLKSMKIHHQELSHYQEIMSSTRLSCLIITTHKRSLRRLWFYTCLSVILLMGVGGLCPCACWNTPPGPKADTLPDQRQTPSWTKGRHPPKLRQTPPKVDIPPSTVHAGRYGQQAGGTYPTGKHTCLWMCLWLSCLQFPHLVWSHLLPVALLLKVVVQVYLHAENKVSFPSSSTDGQTVRG